MPVLLNCQALDLGGGRQALPPAFNKLLKQSHGSGDIPQRVVGLSRMERNAVMTAERRELEIGGGREVARCRLPHGKLHRAEDEPICRQVDAEPLKPGGEKRPVEGGVVSD